MKSSIFIFAFVLFAALFIATTQAQATDVSDTYLTPDLIKDAITQLNVYKCMHNQTYADFYTYSECISDYSQDWANTMATEKNMYHSNTYAQRSCGEKSGFAENIAAGYSSLKAVLTAFYDEVKCWDFKKSAATSKSCVSGHFTALIWKGNTAVGFGVSKAEGDRYGLYWGTNYGTGGKGGSVGNSDDYAGNVTPLVRSKEYCENEYVANYNKNLPEPEPEKKSRKNNMNVVTYSIFVIGMVIIATFM